MLLAAGLAACGAPPAAAPATSASAKDEASAEEVAASPTEVPTAPASPSATATAAPTATPIPTPRPGVVTNVPVLMYHYIRELPPNTPDQLGYGLSIAPKLFDDELSHLASGGYTSISMDTLTSHIVKGTPLPAKPVVLSFDDGYADFYTAAWPLLRKYHLGATIYLVVDFLGKPGYMSWQQAQELRASGVEIGAHTLDHVDLAIQPLAQARRQILDSRQILRQRLDAPVDTFAYPSGRYTQATVKIVADAGFTSAVTTNFGERHTAADLLTMTRVRVPGGISTANFLRNLSG